MVLEQVRTLLQINGNDRDELLSLIIANTQAQLASRIGVVDIPVELDYIIVEVAIARFNRLGSEGMKSESVEGHSVTYAEDDFLAYESVIDRFANPKRRVVRFI